LGYPEHGPYDAIHVGAASQHIPQTVSLFLQVCFRMSTKLFFFSQLIDQLAPGGRLIIPVGHANSDQTLMQIDKSMDGKIKQRSLLGVVFVPLTDKEWQYRRS